MCRKNFTLLEVILALVIFATGLSVTLNITALSRLRTAKATRTMYEEHILTQAVEFFMLECDTNIIPEEIFPYKEYTAKMELSTVEDLPEGVSNSIGNYRLVTMRVELYNEENELCRTIEIERVVPYTL